MQLRPHLKCKGRVNVASAITAPSIAASLPPSPPQQPADLCVAFRAGCTLDQYARLLEDSNDEYPVYASNQQILVTTVIPLADALRAGTDITFSRVQRYRMARTLASSHLQLYSSSWLHYVWSSDDVQISTADDGLGSRTLNHDPYIATDFRPLAGPWPRTDRSFGTLGIVLLELCFGQQFREHKLWKKYPGLEVDPLIQQVVAQAWAEQVEDEAGEDHAIAVNWTLKQAPIQLKDDKWRADFAENVVQPLQRCCESMEHRK